MPAPATFLASAFLQLPVAVALLIVGAKVHQRSRLLFQPALTAFAAFWVGIGTYGLFDQTQPDWTLVVLLLFLPPFLSAVSYATLLRHARAPMIRYRIRLTSWSLI